MKKMGSRQKLPIALKFLSVSSDFKLKIEVGFILMAIATTVSIIDLYDEIAHWLNRKWGFKIYEKK